MKQVRETSAGKSIAAFVILNAKGAHVATVQAYYADGGTVTVNAWAQGDNGAERNALAMGYALDSNGRIVEGKRAGDSAWDVGGLQEGRASGGGYDKFTAALAGMYIDGVKLTDHARRDGSPKPPKGRQTFPPDAKAPKGYTFANYADGSTTFHDGSPRWPNVPAGEVGWTDCYRLEGFKYLEAVGYRVIQAI